MSEFCNDLPTCDWSSDLANESVDKRSIEPVAWLWKDLQSGFAKCRLGTGSRGVLRDSVITNAMLSAWNVGAKCFFLHSRAECPNDRYASQFPSGSKSRNRLSEAFLLLLTSLRATDDTRQDLPWLQCINPLTSLLDVILLRGITLGLSQYPLFRRDKSASCKTELSLTRLIVNRWFPQASSDLESWKTRAQSWNPCHYTSLLVSVP